VRSAKGPHSCIALRAPEGANCGKYPAFVLIRRSRGTVTGTEVRLRVPHPPATPICAISGKVRGGWKWDSQPICVEGALPKLQSAGGGQRALMGGYRLEVLESAALNLHSSHRRKELRRFE
jgi:hypothetical protein